MTTNVILATITAFCHCQVCCGPNATGITAANTIPRPAHTIAAPRNIPFGSRIVVAKHTYIVEDRLAKRYTNRFDIYFSNHQAARRFGIQTNLVTIITP